MKTSNLLAPLILTAIFQAGCNGGASIDNSDTTDVSNMQCNDGLVESAIDIRARFPTWRDAKQGTSISGSQYKEAHTEKEIAGFGVTLVTMTGIANVQDWTGNLNDPSLLFFEKDPNLNKNDWPLIGFGYHHEWEDSAPSMGTCTRPTPDCDGSNAFKKNFIIHEAGYHNNGFEPATNSNVKSGHGSIDAAGCNLIDKDDIKTRVFMAKHGRAWTMHVFLHPETRAPIITTVDPWSRDGGNGWQYTVASNTFYEQGSCGCASPAVQPINVVKLSSLLRLVDEDDLGVFVNYSFGDERDVRVSPNNDGEYELTMVGWLNPLEQLGFLSSDRVIQVQSRHNSDPLQIVDVVGQSSLNTALANIRALEAGDNFEISVERDGSTVTLNNSVF
jgi:hypothetical protein